MKNLISDFLAVLKSLIIKLEADLAAVGSELYTIWEQAYPPAEQAAIADLLPLGKQIITDLQNQGGLTSKQLAAEALAQMETAVVAAGKDFIMTFAMQAISIVMSQVAGNVSASTVSNAGTLTGGTQSGG